MKALTKKEITKLAPAVFEGGRDEGRTTDRYQVLSTADAIKFMGNEGYHVTAAQQMFASKKDNRFTRHVVMLTHEDYLHGEGKFETVPRVLMFNSHNGTTALKLQAGFYRFVCCNGLVVGDTTSIVKLRHNLSAIDVLNEQLQHVAGVARESGDLIEKWKSRKLSASAMDAFAKNAAALRVRGGESASFYETADILKPRRDEDNGNDLWTVFNRVQENLVRGGIEGTRESGRVVTLRPLNNIRRNTEFNQALWDLARKVAA